MPRYRDGHAPFVSGPLVLADAEYFPDPWHGDMDSVAHVIRRCLAISGREKPQVHIIDHTPLSEERLVLTPDLHWVGITDEEMLEFDVTEVGEP